MKIRENAKVLEQERVSEGIYSLWVSSHFSEDTRPGQFVSLFSADSARLLPRPISVCEAREGAIRLVYRVAGAGTEEFSHLRKNDTIEIMGPLGNGFPLEVCAGKRVLLAGGGIGIPPMLFCAEALKHAEAAQQPSAILAVAGYRTGTFLATEMENVADFTVATEDGSVGTKGTVIDAMKENSLEADLLFACGPGPMLKALKAYAQERKMPCWISMEEKMACGIGACLGCVCRSPQTDAHSHVKNKRICKDGPVFNAEDILL